jgi:hypothetical protein
VPPITPSPVFNSLPKLTFHAPPHYIKSALTTGAGIISKNVFMQYDLTFDDMQFVKAYNSARSRKDGGVAMTDDMCETLMETYEKEAAKTTQMVDPSSVFSLTKAVAAASAAGVGDYKCVEAVFNFWIKKRKVNRKAVGGASDLLTVRLCSLHSAHAHHTINTRLQHTTADARVPAAAGGRRPVSARGVSAANQPAARIDAQP